MRTELVTTLKRKATEIISEVGRKRVPVLITQHGRPAATWSTLRRTRGSINACLYSKALPAENGQLNKAALLHMVKPRSAWRDG